MESVTDQMEQIMSDLLENKPLRLYDTPVASAFDATAVKMMLARTTSKHVNCLLPAELQALAKILIKADDRVKGRA